MVLGRIPAVGAAAVFSTKAGQKVRFPQPTGLAQKLHALQSIKPARWRQDKTKLALYNGCVSY